MGIYSHWCITSFNIYIYNNCSICTIMGYLNVPENASYPRCGNFDEIPKFQTNPVRVAWTWPQWMVYLCRCRMPGFLGCGDGFKPHDGFEMVKK